MRTILQQHPVIVVVTLVVIGLLAWGFWPQAVPAEITVVKRGPLAVTIEEDGRTRVIDRYVIAAPVDGVAERIHLDVGDAVEQGQELLGITPLASQVLDPRSRARAEARVAAARSSLQAAGEQARAAAAAAELAQSELRRMRPLLAKGLVSQDAFDRAETQATTKAAAKRSADFSVDVARYELRAAETVLEYSTGTETASPERVPIRSPVDGRILGIAHEFEGPVRTGQALLEVGDPAALEVEVDVLSADAVKIAPGLKVLFERWGGEQRLEGSVRTVEPVGRTKVSALGVEEQRVLVICDFTSPPENWRRLGDGYRVDARFVIWEDSDVLQVPASTLFRHGDGWALFALENGRALLRPVDVGHRNGRAAQILDGLKPGDRVIDHPGDDVADGRRIDVRR